MNSRRPGALTSRVTSIALACLVLGLMLGGSSGCPGSVAAMPDGWESENRLSETHAPRMLGGARAGHPLALSQDETMLDYRATGWSIMISGITTHLDDVSGTSGNDVFAVGDGGTIIHYDGSDWSPMTSGTIKNLSGVWGSSGSDVFAVGCDGTIIHYDGTDWSPMTSGTVLWLRGGVWGSSGSDVFAVGWCGTILHYNGTDWSPMTSGTGNGLYGVWGSSGSDVFAVGGHGTILHYDGPDSTPPTVSSTSPVSGATGVAIDTAVTATFSEAMDASTITTDSFTLAGSAVSGTVTYNSDTYTATFTPDANLDYDHQYTATLTTAITDVAGNPLAAAYSWSFTTEWASSDPLIAEGTLGGSYGARKLARASDGVLHCVYSRSDGSYYQIYHSCSSDGGQTWTEEQVSAGSNNHREPSIAVDSNDHIHVAWRHCQEPSTWGKTCTVQYRAKTTAWQPIEDVITGYGGWQSIAVDSQNNVHLVIGGYWGGAYNCDYLK